MKKFILLVVLYFPILSYCQNYVLSDSFGANGVLQTINTTEPSKTIFTTDNKIVTIGFFLLNNPNPNLITHTSIMKIDQNGNPEVSFGTNGLVQTSIDYKDSPSDVVIQTNGKILVSGSYTIQNPPVGTYPMSPFIARYTNNGALDTTFGVNGIVKILNFNTITSTSSCSAVQLIDNKILLGIQGNGNNLFGALIRLNENGDIDTTFGNNGTLKFDDTNFKFNLSSFLLTDDNKLILCGADRTINSNAKSVIIKLNLDGSYVTSFANNGKLSFDFYSSTSSAYFEYFYELKKSNDGNFIACGHLFNNNVMIKFNSNGELIQTFGMNGILQNFYNYDSFYIQNNNKIVIGGTNLNNGNAMFKITRLNQDGSFDTSFNNSGYYDLEITNENDLLKNVLVDNQNSILMSGYSKLNSENVITHAKIVPENLGINDLIKNKTYITPNPAHNNITINYTAGLQGSMAIYDITGRELTKTIITGDTSNIDIDITNFTKGTYIVVVNDTKKQLQTQHKLIIE